jgi:beta-glucosidase
MDQVSGILMAYYPGQEGGTALAQILFGEVNPSGKLPYVQPWREEDLPRIAWDTTNQWYDYYHGYAKLEKEGVEPLYPYGYGLSYTTFTLDDPHFGVTDGAVTASCRVVNTGNRTGTEVVQLYVGFKHSFVDRPVKLLWGFSRVELERMEYEISIGSSSADRDLLKGSVTV